LFLDQPFSIWYTIEGAFCCALADGFPGVGAVP
jgi:hypothetical protein